MDKQIDVIEHEALAAQDSYAIELSNLQLMIVGGGCGETVVG